MDASTNYKQCQDFYFIFFNSILIVYGIIESPWQNCIIHELQPAVNYRIAVLSKASAKSWTTAWFTEIPMELKISNFHLSILRTSSTWGNTDTYIHLLAQIPFPPLILLHHFLLFVTPYIHSYWAILLEVATIGTGTAAILRLLSSNLCLFHFTLSLNCPLQ